MLVENAKLNISASYGPDLKYTYYLLMYYTNSYEIWIKSVLPTEFSQTILFGQFWWIGKESDLNKTDFKLKCEEKTIIRVHW